MRKFLIGGASLAALSFAVAAYGQTANTLEVDAKAFGARESVGPIDLSPDGTKVLYLTPAGGRKTAAVIGDLSTGQFTTVVSTDGEPESLRWCDFASMKRIVCNVVGRAESAGVDNVVGFSRLIALDVDGGNPKMLGQTDSFYDAWIRHHDGEIIDWLVDSEGAVLMNRLYMPEEGKIQSRVVSTKTGWGVDKVDVTSLKSDTVESPKEAAGYMTDGRGTVRLMSITDTRHSGVLTGERRYFYRTKGSRDWKPLYTVKDITDPDFVPEAVDATIDSLYTLKKKNGRYALYAIKLDGSMAETLVADNPKVDIDGVIRVGKGLKVIGYTYAEEDRRAVYFDTEFKALAASLSKAIPQLPLVDFAGASRDGRKLLIVAGSDSDPGRYYLFDRDKKSLNEAMFARPQLQGRTLASVKSVTIAAPDGAQIPAYLTLPPGKEAKGLPAVLLPHGGPSARDEWGFDWLAQFLAARGYAVLQPNFRGSTGYGQAWRNENGYRNWRTSIGDINASARWLASQGIANPSKLAIVGWSYGGYAALQSAATEPSLYKAVAAVAPVTDLALLKQDESTYVTADLRAKQIGSGPHVAEGSPLRKSAAITASVLLVHGNSDANVRVWHSQKMHDALRGAGKQSELLTYKGLDHGLRDSGARAEMLTKIGALLDRTIGK